jgi:SNF2 family DNA or RNA helicase
MQLLKHQIDILEQTKNFQNVAYYLDMGLGKTFIGSEKVKQINNKFTLVTCQKSKIYDWCEHFKTNYPEFNTLIYKNQKIKELPYNTILIINYDSVWRKDELLKLNNFYFTLMLDESQYIKNESAKRTKFITKKLLPHNIILLSGTPTGGKYEELYTQIKLLGWTIPKTKFYENYIITKTIDVGLPYYIDIVTGYRNVEDLKSNLKKYGAVFMMSDEVITLPEQIETTIKIKNTREYKELDKESVININGVEIVVDTLLKKMLMLRQLAGIRNKNKHDKLTDLIESTNDRLIIFYNFVAEFEILKSICKKLDRKISYVNGSGSDLKNYEDVENSITLIQYQSGSSGLNLQKANKIIYYSPTQSAELHMQSKKRTHRIGQNRACFYYYLVTEKSIEEKIYKALVKGEDYTNKLFERGL